jgi:hypothetical protein
MASSSREDGKILPTYWQILDAARELFAKNGFRDTTIRMISKKAKSTEPRSTTISARSPRSTRRSSRGLRKDGQAHHRARLDRRRPEDVGGRAGFLVTFMLTLFLKEDPRSRSCGSSWRASAACPRSTATNCSASSSIRSSTPSANSSGWRCRTPRRRSCSACSSRTGAVHVLHAPRSAVGQSGRVPVDPRSRWIQMMRKQILANITSRLSFKRNTQF